MPTLDVDIFLQDAIAAHGGSQSGKQDFAGINVT
jgi:hypothetical protein